MDNLLRKSVSIILENQAASGAYIASPNFPAYQYCWFRDGSFIAYAMDLVGEVKSAERFHQWAADRVNDRRKAVDQAISKFKTKTPLTSSDYLFTRYKLDGGDGLEEDWPNFQLDGFGTWLWSLNEHRRRNNLSLPNDLMQAADLVAGYLEALWPSPCFDCWEEFPEQRHPYTLGAIYGGLQAHSEMSGQDHSQAQNAIRTMLLKNWVKEGHFVKFAGSTQVDASLLGLATPYRMVDPEDPIMIGTAQKIETLLSCEGGVHRYLADTYFGGGEWVLLSAWLGWYFAQTGDKEKARKLLEWVERQFEDGGLPEQIPDNLNDPAYYPVWVERWGKIAQPLLWSHANHIILKVLLD